MKKFITSAYSRLGRFVVIAVAGCIFSACSDFLDVPLESTVATSNFYKTAEEFDMGLTGVYNMLLSADGPMATDTDPIFRVSSSLGASEPMR